MSEEHRPKVAIIDGYSLLYRAFFATKFLSTSDGRPTNALYGFSQMLFLLLEKIRPDTIAVAFDAPGKTFRHAEYSEYKGTRRDTPVELKDQLPVARDLLAALGVPSYEATGFEADDVVGTLTAQARAAGCEVVLVTGDLDALQLVDEATTVLTPGPKGFSDPVVYDVAGVVARHGFGPEFVPDMKAIKGDTSDNIPGVPGIGDKGAADLITRFGTIEQMLDRFGEIDEKYRKKMVGNEDQMRKSKWLATIRRDAPVEGDFGPFALTDEAFQKATQMLESFEFKSLVRRAPTVLGLYMVDGEGRTAPPPAAVEHERIEAELAEAGSLEELAAFVGDRKYAFLPVAVPTADLFAEPVRQAFVAIGNDVRAVPEEIGRAWFEKTAGQAVGHDLKPVYRALSAAGRPLATPPGCDTLLAGYVLQSGRANHALRDLATGYLDVQPPTNPAELAVALGRLQETLRSRLEREGQARVLDEIELPLIPILAEMEHLGIAADRSQLAQFSETLQLEIDSLTRTIYEHAGGEFTIGSPKQLGEVLFEKLGLPAAGKTKTGYATGAEVLQELVEKHPIVPDILNWRELTKLKSTYADALGKMIREDGRIHTTYNQTGAATGRLSSNDPNLQNIPIRTELGRGIRRAFVAGPGYRLLSCDYSQIELRVLAHMCGEKALVDAFAAHEDVHAATAKLMFQLGDQKPTSEQRRYAKLLNYAVLYGVTDFGLAQQLGGGFSRAEAKALITTYNERFPTVRDFTKSVVVEARSKGFTTTLSGRRRYFPDIHASRIQDRQYAERQAMNAPIQGTAADLLKLAMIDVRRRLEGTSTRMLLNVHDELVFETPEADGGLVEDIRGKMENALPLKVPVEVDAKIGDNWNEMAKIPPAGAGR